MSERNRLLTVLGVALVATVPLFFLKPIPQDPAYHHFADRRTWLGIPNFGDVASNLPFLAVGLAGIWVAWRSKHTGNDFPERPYYLIFFAGLAFTCFGSSYYHWAPDNARLVWDRLPMTMGFMGLLCATLAERISRRAARWLLLPLIVMGVLSVLYWSHTESLGRGDLRPYVAVQFVSLLLILVMGLFFRSPYPRGWLLLVGVGLYALSKVLEAADGPILRALGISGHTLKHVTAAVAIIPVIYMVAVRRVSRAGGHGH